MTTTRTPYRIIPQDIPQDKRRIINEKIIQCINAGRDLIPRESIYNCYTGDGGLHGLRQEDFSSFHEYTKAKQEAENGQFFTPHHVCRLMTEILAPEEGETVIDICCGMGNMFNFLPDTACAYGCDIDAKAVAVAKHLYPEAHLERTSMMQYDPQMTFDCAIGNPPFNIRTEQGLSQEEYLETNWRLLSPAGLLLMIVPASFMKDAFWDSSRIGRTDRRFSFIGQCPLPEDLFRQSGVKTYPTKLMAFRKHAGCMDGKPYDPSCEMTPEELKEAVAAERRLKHEKKLLLLRESMMADLHEIEEFEYKVKKYLWEFSCHETLKDKHAKAVELVNRFRTQRPPQNCTDKEYKDWEKKRLTPAKVLATLRRQIRRQNDRPQKKVSLVRNTYGFSLKQYSQGLIPQGTARHASVNDLLNGLAEMPSLPDGNASMTMQRANALKSLERKRRELDRQTQPFHLMTPDPQIDAYLTCATFVNRDGKTCSFTPTQRQDLNLVMQKRHALLNWQQGSGKTAAAYHRSLYLLRQGRVKNVVILAPAIAVNLTWIPFLTANGAPFRTLRKPQDVVSAPEGEFLVVPLSMLRPLKRELSRMMKLRSRKICLVFDEADELTNPHSQRTRLALDLFRRSAYKLLATGTTTRNNIAEIYSQIEMIYNNSAAMTCRCPEIIETDSEGEPVPSSNDWYGSPYPARRGHVLFRKCHCPSKTTVFGIEKQNQDIYHQEELKELLSYTVITRKFKDFAGDRYSIRTHTVRPSEEERAVQEKIVKEFHAICHRYYNDTGDARKESALRLMRQIKLLIRSCSVPHTMEGYGSQSHPGKARAICDLVGTIGGKAAIGCTSLEALRLYADLMAERYPQRPLTVIDGSIPFERRLRMAEEFNRTKDGILVCTQQSLSSSANIPDCDDVILESLQWNIPRMEQFYFRFIRLDSKNEKRVHMFTYEESIEQNLTALVLTKERLNDFIKSGEVTQQSDILDEFDVDFSIIDSLIRRSRNDDGSITLSWGQQRAS